MRMCNAFRMLGVLLAAGIGIARGQSTYCVSATENGVVSNGWSGFGVSMSPDGRYVAFDSYATNLAPQGGNGYWQVLIHDRETGELELVSQTSGGDLAIRSATQPSVSADGRFVAFIAEASNFDSFPQGGIFVRDRVARTTSRAILSSAGGLPNGGCFDPALSADGRFLAFTTTATNLAGGGSSGPKVFVLDRATGVTSNVSVNSSGQAADADCFSPRISSDGRYVAFESYATNLYTSASNANPYYFRHDRASGMTARVVASASGGDVQNAFGYGLPSISADGRFVAFSSFGATLVPDDTNGQEDVFVRDMDAGVTVRASVDSAGVQGNLDSFHAVISADGRFVVFDSYATNLVPGGTNGSRQVIVHDLASGATRLASTGASGTAGNRSSGQYQRDSSGNMRFPPNTAISREGRRIAFASEATNLVPGEFNNVQDVFVREQWSLSVDSVLPSSGSESGGDLVTLRGIGFESATDTGVDFGGTAAKASPTYRRRSRPAMAT
ncbi:MAG: PD40 domain-containing protein [Planctomycetes bacterium]|nr:PD40 domain-containing protein [Planctomycetota bacterium]